MSTAPAARRTDKPKVEDAIALDLVLGATRGTLARRGPATFAGAGIDGRAVPAGGLFFAIKGERFDGHDFAAQAAEHGAAGIVVGRGRAAALPKLPGVAVIEVDDTTLALGDLARARTAALVAAGLRIAGVAGSNGKTTTKELIAAVLAAHAGADKGDGRVLKTEGNLNNHLGVPLTLLRLSTRHRFAVVEMGMSALGELDYLARIVRPHVACVVSIGPEHLEHLLTVENVARAEGEIFAALAPSGCAVWPDGEERVRPYAEASRAVRRLRFGSDPGVPVRVLHAAARLDGTDVRLRLPDGAVIDSRLAVVGLHNAMNAACAAAVASALGAPAAAIARGLGAAQPAKHRSTLVEIGGRHVIDDCYNASPPSTSAALDTLAALAAARPGARALAVLGDMLELGAEELLLHRNIGAHAAARVDLLLTVGERSRETAAGAREAGLAKDRTRHLASVEEAVAVAAAESAPGDVILVKASRGARLERVLDGLRTVLAAPQQGAA